MFFQFMFFPSHKFTNLQNEDAKANREKHWIWVVWKAKHANVIIIFQSGSFVCHSSFILSRSHIMCWHHSCNLTFSVVHFRHPRAILTFSVPYMHEAHLSRRLRAASLGRWFRWTPDERWSCAAVAQAWTWCLACQVKPESSVEVRTYTVKSVVKLQIHLHVHEGWCVKCRWYLLDIIL